MLREHIERCRARCAALGVRLQPDAFLFSGSPDGSTFARPDGVTQRYERLAARLGIGTTFHKLRHYSATELITGGVDPRTVAGRLGHGGGGTTTLKTYTAWVSEADQRAAKGLSAGMPQRPAEIDETERARTEPRHPYEKVAAEIGQRIRDGELRSRAAGPTAVEPAEALGVSVATARRGVALAKQWGLLVDGGHAGPRVAEQPIPPPGAPEVAGTLNGLPLTAERGTPDGASLLDLVIRRRGVEVARFSTAADPRDVDDLREVLVDAAIRQGGSEATIGEYEMDVRHGGEEVLITTFVVSRRRAL